MNIIYFIYKEKEGSIFTVLVRRIRDELSKKLEKDQWVWKGIEQRERWWTGTLKLISDTSERESIKNFGGQKIGQIRRMPTVN